MILIFNIFYQLLLHQHTLSSILSFSKSISSTPPISVADNCHTDLTSKASPNPNPNPHVVSETSSTAPIVLPPSLSSHPMVTRSKTGHYKPKQHFSLTATSSFASSLDIEPKSFSEASKHPEWQQAMAAEYQALIQQGTWTLVPCPSNINLIGC